MFTKCSHLYVLQSAFRASALQRNADYATANPLQRQAWQLEKICYNDGNYRGTIADFGRSLAGDGALPFSL